MIIEIQGFTESISNRKYCIEPWKIVKNQCAEVFHKKRKNAQILLKRQLSAHARVLEM